MPDLDLGNLCFYKIKAGIVIEMCNSSKNVTEGWRKEPANFSNFSVFFLLSSFSSIVIEVH